MKTAEERFWAKVDKSGDCWEWTGYLAPNGYGQFGAGGRWYAHRYSYALDRGLSSSELPPVVRHMCDNPGCVNPAHLIGGTQADNMRDRMNRSRAPAGSGHWNAKIDEGVASYIRDNTLGLTRAELAELSGATPATVGRIQRKERWRHVT